MCGASILSYCVAGASYSGMQTAAGILGKTQSDIIRSAKGQKVRVCNSDDDTDYPEWMRKNIEVKRSRVDSIEIRFSK